MAIGIVRLDTAGPMPPIRKLRRVGHNIGFDTPIEVDAVDIDGVVYQLTLKETIALLDEFEPGTRTQTTSENIIDCCFIAYEYGMMSADERECFEAFVRSRVEEVGNAEAAKRIVLNRRAS